MHIPAKDKRNTIQLNAKDAEIFLNALITPVHFNKKLLSAIKKHTKRVTSK